MEPTATIFILVYIGMLAGGLPFLQLDRAGIALLGAIGLLASGAISLDQAGHAIHVPTLLLLFSFMVIAAQLRLGGFYAWIANRIGGMNAGPHALLAALVVAVAGLAAVFSNDVVCLAVAPVWIEICERRRLDPVPFLLALACAANIGSAATLIGNPQNMLLGGALGLSFSGYLKTAAVPVLAGIGVIWLVIARIWQGRWDLAAAQAHPAAEGPAGDRGGFLDPWQAAKGLAVAATLFGLFLASDRPREILALGGAGILLLSRKLHSRDMLGLVDWQVLVLFIGLFIVNDALERTGLPHQAVAALAAYGVDLQHPAVLYGATFVLSNLVSNVPAIMLLLPAASHRDGALLALSSTFAGNLLLVGSIANMIVLDAAAQRGIRISWKQHAMVGVPVTAVTLGVAAATLLPGMG